MRLPKQGDWYDVDQIKKMVDYFMEKGFSFFDTAYVYDGGKSEMVAKEVLVDRYPRDSFQLVSKMPVWVCSEAADMEKVLDPKLYIGRCPEQVTRFVAKVRPLLEEAPDRTAEINL